MNLLLTSLHATLETELTADTGLVVLFEDVDCAAALRVWQHGGSDSVVWGPGGVRFAVVVPEYISACCAQGRVVDPVPFHPQAFWPGAVMLREQGDGEDGDGNECDTDTNTAGAPDPDSFDVAASLGPYFARLDYRALVPLICTHLEPEDLPWVRLASRAFRHWGNADAVWHAMWCKRYGGSVPGPFTHRMRYGLDELYDPEAAGSEHLTMLRARLAEAHTNPLAWDAPQTPEGVLAWFHSLHPEASSHQELYMLRKSLEDGDHDTSVYSGLVTPAMGLRRTLHDLSGDPGPARPEPPQGIFPLAEDPPCSALPLDLLRARRKQPLGLALGMNRSDSRWMPSADSREDLLHLVTRHSDLYTVRKLAVGPWYTDEYRSDTPQRITEVLVAPGILRRLRGVRSMYFGDVPDSVNMISDIHPGDLAPLLRAYPTLRHLRIQGSRTLLLRPLQSSCLETLAIICGGLDGLVFKQLLYSRLPRLHRLVLYFGSSYYGASWTLEDLAILLREGPARFPRLRYLGLCDAKETNAICARLEGAPLAAQITTLDLSHGTLSDKGARHLFRLAPPQSRLRRLVLHHNYLSEAMITRLRGAFPRDVEIDVSGRQTTDEEEQEDEPPNRYISVSE